MARVTQMNKDIFTVNLESAIKEIQDNEELHYEEVAFIVEAVEEPGKPLDGADDMMRLWILAKKNVEGRQFSLQNAVDLLAWKAPFVPIWIDVSFVKMDEAKAIFKLKSSLRLRKPTLLRNADTGHAPFRAVLNV
ncbi:hypothetical protein ASD24_18300 [Paenibacillus sp. Root52]|uniref:hypothetical protein n=1 Tax=Paenibacillus sp. Root52 TaxID=1736552 RepID=UPI0006F370D6|nr:hypothetical protein [Paenibacillus sp. Root52]KQY79896.1 hypothetical protein ASD24_18300 [Paenibacillus sp. Root52]